VNITSLFVHIKISTNIHYQPNRTTTMEENTVKLPRFCRSNSNCPCMVFNTTIVS